MSMNFMDIHRDQILVVDKPMLVGQVGMLPFYRKNDVFVSEMNNLASSGAKYLFCHQEFNGCQYENGFYSPHGVDPTLIPESINLVLGGHIHKQQRFGKIWYPGTPRHLTKSDIGENKGIWHVNFSAGKEIKIDTPEEVSLPFVEVNVTPDFKGDLSKLCSPRTYVNVIGPSDFVKSVIKKIPEGTKVRTLPQSEVVETTIKESEGIPKAFFNFSMEYANKNNLGNNEIKVIMKKIYDKCPKLKGST